MSLEQDLSIPVRLSSSRQAKLTARDRLSNTPYEYITSSDDNSSSSDSSDPGSDSNTPKTSKDQWPLNPSIPLLPARFRKRPEAGKSLSEFKNAIRAHCTGVLPRTECECCREREIKCWAPLYDWGTNKCGPCIWLRPKKNMGPCSMERDDNGEIIPAAGQEAELAKLKSVPVPTTKHNGRPMIDVDSISTKQLRHRCERVRRAKKDGNAVRDSRKRASSTEPAGPGDAELSSAKHVKTEATASPKPQTNALALLGSKPKPKIRPAKALFPKRAVVAEGPASTPSVAEPAAATHGAGDGNDDSDPASLIASLQTELAAQSQIIAEQHAKLESQRELLATQTAELEARASLIAKHTAALTQKDADLATQAADVASLQDLREQMDVQVYSLEVELAAAQDRVRQQEERVLEVEGRNTELEEGIAAGTFGAGLQAARETEMRAVVMREALRQMVGIGREVLGGRWEL